MRAFLVLAVVLGCGTSSPTPTDSTGGSSSATAESSGPAASSTGGTAIATSADIDTSDDKGTAGGLTDQLGSGSTSIAPSSSVEAEGGGQCDPDSQSDPCLMCVVDPCCTSWSACMADEGCACVVDCHVIEGSSLGSCESRCDSDGELYQALFFCGQMYCLAACEWDCCAAAP